MPTMTETTERVVLPGEFLFSTTDSRGVIQSSNAAFERIAAYSKESLHGHPHNILRHPQMPAGVFAMVWELLGAGKVAAAHVLNRAADGSDYWVLATMSPLGDDYLSVRVAPANHEVFDRIKSLYRAALGVETQAAEAGLNRRDVAQVGKQFLVDRLAEMGLPSVEDYMRHLLPDEVLRHAPALSVAESVVAEPGELQRLAAASLETERSLLDLLAALADYVAVAGALDEASHAAANMEEAVRVAAEISSQVSDESPVLGKTGEGVVTQAREVLDVMSRLTACLHACHELSLDLRLSIALAKLHATAVTAFVREMAQPQPDAALRRQITQLTHSLAHTLDQVDATLADIARGLSGVADDIAALDNRASDFQRALHTWRHLVVRFNLSDTYAARLGPIDEQLNKGMGRMRRLREIAAMSRDLAQPVETESVHLTFSRFLALLAASA